MAQLWTESLADWIYFFQEQRLPADLSTVISCYHYWKMAIIVPGQELTSWTYRISKTSPASLDSMLFIRRQAANLEEGGLRSNLF
jgi:hypothetical protein